MSTPMVRRRQLVRGAAAACAVTAVSGIASACGVNTAKAAKTTTAQNRTVVTFSPWSGTRSPAVKNLYQQVVDKFNNQQGSIEVKVTPISQGNFPGTAASILAGTAPDIFEDWRSSVYVQPGLLLDLTGYVNGHDMSIFNQSTLKHFTQGGKLYAMPVSIESVVTAVNLSMLDAAGASYPPQTWTTDQAKTVYETLAKPGASTPRYGGVFYFDYGYPIPAYLHGFKASYVDPSDPSQCALGSADAVTCGEYIFGLVNSKVCGYLQSGKSSAALGQDQLGTSLCGSWMLPEYASLPSSVKWEFYPMPAGPGGSTTYGSVAMYGIPATTKHPKEAWSFLEWISFQPTFQKALIQMFLLPPATIPLYADWVALAKAYAPTLGNKNLEAFQGSLADAIVPADFQYDSSNAFTLVSKGCSQITSTGAAVAEVFPAIATQVDAFEKTQASTASSSSASAPKSS